jgi:8-oxo-dGTP diphosphatase
MQKGIDYPGISVCFYCHDGAGNYVLHKRSAQCRDEHHRWDFGGGGLRVNEPLLEAVSREVQEEYGTSPKAIEFLGFDESFREHDGIRTHWIGFRYRVLVDRSLVVNNEPEKHEELGWYRIHALPEPLHSELPKEIEKYKDYLV